MSARARMALGLLRGPADVLLAVRMAGWSLLLPVAKRALPIERLARIMWARRTRAERDRRREELVVKLSSWMWRLRRRPSADNCLERSLLAYRYLSLAGAEPHLLMGINRQTGPSDGHAWVVLDGLPLHDTPESLRDFVPLVEFGADGLPSRPAAREEPAQR